MIGYSVSAENFSPIVKVIYFVEVGKLLCRKELALQCQKNSLCLFSDLVGKVEVPGTGQAGL